MSLEHKHQAHWAHLSALHQDGDLHHIVALAVVQGSLVQPGAATCMGILFHTQKRQARCAHMSAEYQGDDLHPNAASGVPSAA